ncbi:MGMT family protein [Luedemannella helvata]|uniref:Methylated-DNA-[protein]-cysteine S-methyltransferase DNA binding domain-containing protein n=1 Tax=Luedemannella helvata TaxID=349315 RepID=A0ABN2L610_9ACTN
MVYDPQEYVEAVLALVESIPPGRVMSYGAIADALHDRFERGSARRVGTIMAQWGGGVPWHRVVSGGGRLPPGHELRARALLAAEGVVFRGSRVRMAEYAWHPGDTDAGGG